MTADDCYLTVHEGNKRRRYYPIHSSDCWTCFFLAQCQEQVARVNRVSLQDDDDLETRMMKLPCFVK